MRGTYRRAETTLKKACDITVEIASDIAGDIAGDISPIRDVYVRGPPARLRGHVNAGAVRFGSGVGEEAATLGFGQAAPDAVRLVHA